VPSSRKECIILFWKKRYAESFFEKYLLEYASNNDVTGRLLVPIGGGTVSVFLDTIVIFVKSAESGEFARTLRLSVEMIVFTISLISLASGAKKACLGFSLLQDIDNSKLIKMKLRVINEKG